MSHSGGTRVVPARGPPVLRMSSMLHLPSGQYFGRVIARGHVAGLRATETAYVGGAELPWHCHATPYLVVWLGGATFETAGRRGADCVRGTLVWNTVGEPHRDRVGTGGARCLNIELDQRWLDFADADRGRARRNPCTYTFAGAAIDAVGRLEVAFRRACAPRPHPTDNDADDDIDAAFALHHLLDAAAGRDAPQRGRSGRTRSPAWLSRVIELLHDERDDDDAHSLAAIAAIAGVHPAHLCRAFLAHVGCTVGDYARRVRADRAFAMIVNSARPLAAIAAEAGYTDQSHLTRALRRGYGLPPATLRRACRGANRVQDAPAPRA